ncbi:carboxylic ester hydrolase [Trinickia caryophylli]|uniref:Para-nitrobenzyl esterase n=2 Tax=Trinickia caryophylli TaxID=28094 RepID=A0A1X7FA09_TRICW|nr:carboxylic ester hydrolase [Trinickia caryophylli]SMF48792.1 para-nitrobenzyl esterase [Trinickia caryophylli]
MGANAAPSSSAISVELPEGTLAGVRQAVGSTSVRVFRGVPYAAPPVGDYRWREPQPVARWAGVRKATRFGAACMQATLPGASRASDMSEDCLYLNVWAPMAHETDKLPVLVYLHGDGATTGGGFSAGDGAQPRYDGAQLAARGIVVVTLNYRLGVFGFLSHPELARESSHGGAGNYGLLDQHAALRWVRENIGRFGGDASAITLAGQGAGAVAVSAHMASPLSRGLFARAIGESGGAFKPIEFWPKEHAKKTSLDLAKRLGASSLAELRAVPAAELMKQTDPNAAQTIAFWPSIDGHFLPATPESIFLEGQQARVPLLLGSNSQESHFSSLLDHEKPTPANWSKIIDDTFYSQVDRFLALYPGRDEDEVMRSATALASDLFTGHSTWRWMDAHRKTGQAPVYYYLYTHPRPAARAGSPATAEEQPPQPTMGPVHTAEIEYVFGNLNEEPGYAWTEEDRAISQVFSGYMTQFVKTGAPNDQIARTDESPHGAHAPLPRTPLPQWPAAGVGEDVSRQSIGATTFSIRDSNASRQSFLREYLARFPSIAGMNP